MKGWDLKKLQFSHLFAFIKISAVPCCGSMSFYFIEFDDILGQMLKAPYRVD